jgi:hypothetical protein
MMCTVVRFVSKAEAAAELTELGRALNERRPGTFDRLPGNNTRFTCDVSEESNWHAHHRAIARDDKESMVAYVTLGFTPDVVSMLGAAGIHLDVTSY